MIYNTIHPYLQNVYNGLTSKRFDIGEIICKKFKGKIYIDFNFDEKYKGCIYPFGIIFALPEMKKTGIENIINYVPNTNIKNDDVCESCKKLKFYPDIFMMTLYGDIYNYLKGKNVILFVFCKHYNILDFLEFDYILCNSESSISLSEIWD